MNRFQILVDECVSKFIVQELRRRLADVRVLVVGEVEAPEKSTADSRLLEFCEQRGYLLLSADRRTMPGHMADHHRNGSHTYGALMVGRGMRAARVVDEIAAICRASQPEEWIDRLLYLPLSGGGRY